MGAEVCRAVFAETDMQLVAAVDPVCAGTALSSVAGVAVDFRGFAASGAPKSSLRAAATPPNPPTELIIGAGPEALRDAGAEVAVDFTVASSALANIKSCIDSGIHVIVGTTGLLSADLEGLGAQAQARGTGLFVAPNFAIGAVLMMKFAEMAARWLPDAEIIELHHPGKLDSPSGTAIKTMEGIVGGRQQAPDIDTRSTSQILPGARGAESDGVHIHSVRLPGLVAHQEVIFGGPGQTLTIRHDSMDRTSFMPGVLLAIREISKHPGLTIGLEHLLGL